MHSSDFAVADVPDSVFAVADKIDAPAPHTGRRTCPEFDALSPTMQGVAFGLAGGAMEAILCLLPLLRVGRQWTRHEKGYLISDRGERVFSAMYNEVFEPDVPLLDQEYTAVLRLLGYDHVEHQMAAIALEFISADSISTDHGLVLDMGPRGWL